jgi:hypothetical protein
MRCYTYFFPFVGAQSVRDGHSEGVMEGLGFSSIDTKPRSVCASIFSTRNPRIDR